MRVVGIGVTRDNVVSVNALASAPTMLATPAFTRRFGPDHYAFDGAEVTLAPGTSKAAFSAAAQSIARRFPETGGNLQIADEADQAAQVNHTIRPQAVALAGFALLTALAALFAIGQLLARQVFLVSDDNGALRALGMSRRQLVVSGLAQVGATALVGALSPSSSRSPRRRRCRSGPAVSRSPIRVSRSTCRCSSSDSLRSSCCRCCARRGPRGATPSGTAEPGAQSDACTPAVAGAAVGERGRRAADDGDRHRARGRTRARPQRRCRPDTPIAVTAMAVASISRPSPRSAPTSRGSCTRRGSTASRGT